MNLQHNPHYSYGQLNPQSYQQQQQQQQQQQTQQQLFQSALQGHNVQSNAGSTVASSVTAMMNSGVGSASALEENKIHALVVELMDPSTRENALLELSKKREQYDDLALVLWHSFG